MAAKAIIIDVAQNIKSTGAIGKWEKIGNITEFTNNITTPKIDDCNRESIVTGMPSIFARAKMFKLSFECESASVSPSMMQTYSDMIEEWKGFISCIALNTNINIHRVFLKYSDGKSIYETANPYEPLGAFGAMHFDEKDVWSVQGEGEKQSEHPFIDIIKLDGQVLGATSPYTLLFTSPSYRVDDIRYSRGGKFVDPLKLGNLNDRDLLKLYAYVKNITEHFEDYRNIFNVLDSKLRPNFEKIIGVLNNWFSEIRAKAIASIDNAAANDISGFEAPFNVIFNCSDELYAKSGHVSGNSKTFEDGAIAFHPKDLLLPEGSEIARFHFDEEIDPKRLPVYLLNAKIKGTDKETYFALPFTAKGLAVFGDRIGSLFDNTDQEVPTHIEAIFDEQCPPMNNNLHVTLHLGVDRTKKKSVSVSYRIKNEPIENKDLLIWPNFITPQWNKYFLYSELPHNKEIQTDFHAEPFVGNLQGQDFRPVTDNDGEPLYLTGIEKPLEDRGVISEAVVNACIDTRYHYDIYESNVPFYGLRLTCSNQECGYLIIHYGTDVDGREDLPKNQMRDPRKRLESVNLGFDFGSTNTSIAYCKKDDTEVNLVEIKDRRISLLGLDSVDRKMHPRDVLFFYHAPKKNGKSVTVKSNSIKSMLALHDPKLLMRNQNLSSDGHYSITNRELNERFVSGGFPCLVNNLPIIDVLADQIKLKFNNDCVVNVVNDMKWADNPTITANISAFVKTTLLYVYAELFVNKLYPGTLNWSYPAAMTETDVAQKYNVIWKSLNCDSNLAANDRNNSSISPVKDENLSLVPLEVKNYSRNINVQTTSGEDMLNTLYSGTHNDVPLNLSSGGADDILNLLGGNASSSNPLSSEEGFSVEDFFSKIENADVKTESTQSVSYSEILKKEDPKQVIELEKMDVGVPLTEAEAVANYSVKLKQGVDHLVLCFDVGGSTTDISAIYELNGNLSMIKQNSVQFAARRISNATRKYSEEFKNVIDDMCQQFNLEIIGFNRGNKCYNSDTAPFFYEQIVDTLQPNQLGAFYDSIASKCPQLFAVNMYVTGMIMYYAGQLSRKVFEVIGNNDPNFGRKISGATPTFKFQPVFEGKGGRIFEWLSIKNLQIAHTYYRDMFVTGFGMPGRESLIEKFLDLSNLKKESSDRVKIEVSGGLASCGNLMVPTNGSDLEIFGEDNFESEDSGTTIKYEFHDGLTKAKMELIGTIIRQYDMKCPRFIMFMAKYKQYVTQIFGVKFDDQMLLTQLQNIQIGQYIKSKCPEFLRAMKKKQEEHVEFGFVSPIIIQEAIKFYDETLLKCIK